MASFGRTIPLYSLHQNSVIQSQKQAEKRSVPDNCINKISTHLATITVRAFVFSVRVDKHQKMLNKSPHIKPYHRDKVVSFFLFCNYRLQNNRHELWKSNTWTERCGHCLSNDCYISKSLCYIFCRRYTISMGMYMCISAFTDSYTLTLNYFVIINTHYSANYPNQ